MQVGYTMNKADRDFAESLVLEVQKRHAIKNYVPSHPDHKDRQKIQLEWTAISAELNNAGMFPKCFPGNSMWAQYSHITFVQDACRLIFKKKKEGLSRIWTRYLSQPKRESYLQTNESLFVVAGEIII